MGEFNEDKEKGNKGEQAIARLLEDSGSTDIKIQIGDKSDYDISAISKNGVLTTYEVKTDYFMDSGNMALEIFCLKRMRPSGILVCKADWFVYIYDSRREAWFIRTKDLIEKIQQSNSKHRVTNGWQDGNSVIYKMPRHDIQDIAYKKDIHKYL